MLFALLVLCPVKSPAQEAYDYVVTVGNEQIHFVAQPDAGYVVKAQQKTATIEALSGMLKPFGAVDIRPIRGLGRKGISVVYNEQTTDENEKTITMLTAHSQVHYAAPLFSSNGEIVAIIPEIVVRVRPGTDTEELQALCETMGLAIIKRMEFTEQEYLVEVLGTDADAVFDAVEQLNQVSFIEWTTPNIALRLQLAGQVMPDDEYFPNQWHLHNTGQSGGTPNADINAPEAWVITTGDPNIIVAVLDDGVDSSHPDLINNLVPGYDFYEDDNSPNPQEDDAHGTSCAGLIAAQGNNRIGVTGVAWNCKIMPIRILGPDEFITDANIATAFRWAANHGADVLSNSWIFLLPMPITHSAIVDVTKLDGMGRDGKGCVVFASAGNSGSWVDYPAFYPEVIAVGATDDDNVVWDYSNFGPTLDITAPSGDALPDGNIWTTDIVGSRGFNNRQPRLFDYTDKMGGTSGACPIAAGVTALILSVDPNLTNIEVQRILLQSAVDLGEPGWDEHYGFGRVDAFAAVNLVLNPPPPTFVFVDDDAPGANDGSSWADAFNCLQNALAAARYGDEVRIAQGTYKPDQKVVITARGPQVGSSGDRTETFRLRDGMTIKGSYAGFGEPDPNARDITAYETILSGDLNGDDVDVSDPRDLLSEPTRAENSYHVVTSSGTNVTAVLDGITITAGNADGSFFPDDEGGGMANSESSPTLTNCTFIGNSAWNGGGMANFESSPTLTNCTFSGNAADYGGGMDNYYDSNPTLTNCTFNGNLTVWDGSGMYNFDSSPTLTNCILSRNSAGDWGGGMCNSSDIFTEEESNPTLTNCVFSDNSAATYGGGMYNDLSSPTLANCTFSGNSAVWDGGGMANSWSNPALTNCTFSGNAADYGGGMDNYDSNPALNNCTFNGNSTVWDGGGMFNFDSSPTLTNCIFSRNSAGDWGGGMCNSSGGPTLTNCTFIGNSAVAGGGMYNDWSSLTATNCTFAANTSIQGNVIACDSDEKKYPSNVELTNCILWDGGDEIWNNDSSTITITYSDVQVGRRLPWPGEGNINADPLFVNAAYGDYHLKSQAGKWDPNSQSWVIDEVTSPCIDAGNPGTPVGLEPLPNGGIINMGAYGGTAEASKSPAN